MIEITIHGRGGQGGVTLAKLIASAYFLRDKHVQAFGVYAAERSGAPLQAFVRIDDEEITNHNQVSRPNHVIVLDPTLIGPNVTRGLCPDGWVILNTSQPADAYAEVFAGRKVAVVDGTGIAVAHGLGTRAVPIVNTTLLGAVARVFGLELADVDAALASVKFGGSNVDSAREAFEAVRTAKLPGRIPKATAAAVNGHVAGILDPDTGGMPTIRTGNWATRAPHRRQLTPPCNNGCPAGNDVRSFVEAAGREDYAKALETILQTSPFPAVCGRVCPAPCMEACNRAELDQAVNIREIERYVADHAPRPEPTQPWRAHSVAVVGSGPAGLSAAYSLARLGYRVELFEGGAALGGLLRTGIPEYRLPEPVLVDEIEYILAHGVVPHLKHFVDREELHRLSTQFDAVFVGTGLQIARGLKLGPEAGGSAGRVEQGIDFLDRVRREDVSLRRQDVVVIGGGNTAIDAARTAVRLGAHRVRIVYRRTRDQMPAIMEEVHEGLDEGVELHELVAPLRMHEDVGRLTLTCQRMRLGEPDASGRAQPVPETTDDAIYDLVCDRIILALGQSSDLSIVPEGAEMRDDHRLVGLSGAPIFLGGDFADNAGTVTAAIGSGRTAALHIHRTLTGEDLFPPPAEAVATSDVIGMQLFAHRPREEGVMLPPHHRRITFTEVRRGFLDEPSHHPAAAEAQRCFSCGVCNHCDRCVQHCPEGIVRRDGAGYEFDYSYCKGCGLCASQCPRGVVYMAEL